MTYHPKSEFIHVMMERGYLADCTDYQSLDDGFAQRRRARLYWFDATASSLHVGS